MPKEWCKARQRIFSFSSVRGLFARSRRPISCAIERKARPGFQEDWTSLLEHVQLRRFSHERVEPKALASKRTVPQRVYEEPTELSHQPRVSTAIIGGAISLAVRPGHSPYDPGTGLRPGSRNSFAPAQPACFRCPKCATPMVVVERLSARTTSHLSIRSPTLDSS
jgi:hypothetical protein